MQGVNAIQLKNVLFEYNFVMASIKGAYLVLITRMPYKRDYVIFCLFFLENDVVSFGVNPISL